MARFRPRPSRGRNRAKDALGLLKQRTEAKVGIKIRRLRAAWDDNFLLRVLGLQHA